jgi:hypothetical protein
VNVRRGTEAARPDEGLDDDCLAARLAGRLPEDETLAGDGVLYARSGVDHRGSPCGSIRTLPSLDEAA